jgi:cell wall-associated NlpC family hydrolase
VSRSELKPGDLLFIHYPNSRGIPPGKASHIEIYLGNGRSMGTDNPREGARIEPIDWAHVVNASRVPALHR